MVTFELEKEIRAPPQFVVDWWLDFSADDASLPPGQVRRQVRRVDERTTRLTTETNFGGRARKTDGLVTRMGPTNWQLTAKVSTDGTFVSTMTTTYSVEPTPGGSRVRAEFEFQGETFLWKFLLSLSRFYLRRDRNRSFKTYVVAIQQDYEAGRGRGGNSVSSGGGPADPGASA